MLRFSRYGLENEVSNKMKKNIVFLLVLAGGIIMSLMKSEEEGMRKYALEDRLRVPSVKEVSENPYIYRYNHELCKDKGLLKDGRLSHRYLCLQAVYRANLDAYLLKMLDIRQLDEELRNSGLGFVRPKPKNRNLYERESGMNLEYIWLRNNLYIEYLGKEQLSLLEQRLETGGEAVTNELQNMIEETYREVIRVRNPQDQEESGRFFYAGTKGKRPEIPSDALVLEITNAMEYDAAGNLLRGDRMREKCEYLEKVRLRKEKEYSEILGTEVYILVE